MQLVKIGVQIELDISKLAEACNVEIKELIDKKGLSKNYAGKGKSGVKIKNLGR